MSFVVVIPARYQSSRLPGKVLADIQGKPMIQWVYEKALASGADKVIIATDNDAVEQAVKGFGAEVCRTRADHQSGTERLAEVVVQYGFNDDDIIVNVQGDEPFIPSENIAQVANNLAAQNSAAHPARMSTLAVAISEADEVFNSNAVKVVLDKNGYALYFSRASVPYNRDAFAATGKISELSKAQSNHYLRHIGIYAYRAAFIKDYVSWPASELEHIEALEQLRVLYQGEKIHVDVAQNRLPVEGVDTQQDLDKARQYAATLSR
ncbi:3-deoxy-manno-octulosonate cytidylyltransferase [Thalassotalea ponticola]|uniref:3-deoxy-manno-octulosonate cytidylyltransferase n=1 Tax=Thalassotalea ponticola TaxID=1523392 RepID=UPI0025B5B132|nr:3-deoxy-manno-octulosonate cytidylyltransferase [Thalassotalea ponticola]MDN3652626.1 3-deoxy-manno-octulosonate cytidylyltransferase [Thalassotalea ponticola]